MRVELSIVELILYLYKNMDQVYKLPSEGPAGTDEIAIQLYSKHKLTQDIKAQLAYHFTAKLPKPNGNRLLLIGAKVGITARLMEPHCSEIHIVSESKYIPILQALFVKQQAVQYRFNTQGNIGEQHYIPKKTNPHCKYTVIEVSKFREYVQKNIHYDIVLLQNVIVHPDINILKQLMRLRHDVLISMIVPGKLAHKGLFQLISGIQQNILHVFYTQAVHQQVEYMRYLTNRRQEINIWEVFVWIKKNAVDVRLQLKQVQQILQQEVAKHKVSQKTFVNSKGSDYYESQACLSHYLDFHYGQTQYFGIKNFPETCAHKLINAAKSQQITGRVLDVGCAVGRSTVQLAKYFNEAIGIEYSQKFVKAAQQVLQQKYKDVANKVKYLQGDACKLNADLGKFDAIFAGNLIDRLYEPQKFLRSIVNFLNDKSILILTSPYSWLEDYTKPQNWLGGKQVNGKDVTTYQRLKQILGQLGLKEFKHPEDIRFVIQQNLWVYQYTSSQMTYWGKF